MTADTLTHEAPEAAQAASLPVSRGASADAAVFLQALGATLAAAPMFAEVIEEQLSGIVSQGRLNRDGAGTRAASQTLEWFRDLRGAASLSAPAATSDVGAANAMPPASPALILWRQTCKAIVSALGPRKSRRFLHALLDAANDEPAPSNVVPMRRAADLQEIRNARSGALAYLRATLPHLLAAMDRKGA